MKLQYEHIENWLENTFRKTKQNGITYYFDKSGVVARKFFNVICLYVYCHSSIIKTHCNKAVFAIANKFKLIENFELKEIADVAVIAGLCEPFNIIYKSPEGQLLQIGIDSKLDSYSNIGYIEEYKLSTLGEISQDYKIRLNGLSYEFDLSEFDLNQSSSGFRYDNLVYGILRVKKSKKSFKKTMVKLPVSYNWLRQKYDWFYTQGYNSGNAEYTRDMIDKLQTGTNFHKLVNIKVSCLD